MCAKLCQRAAKIVKCLLPGDRKLKEEQGKTEEKQLRAVHRSFLAIDLTVVGFLSRSEISRVQNSATHFRETDKESPPARQESAISEFKGSTLAKHEVSPREKQLISRHRLVGSDPAKERIRKILFCWWRRGRRCLCRCLLAPCMLFCTLSSA